MILWKYYCGPRVRDNNQQKLKYKPITSNASTLEIKTVKDKRSPSNSNSQLFVIRDLGPMITDDDVNDLNML